MPSVGEPAPDFALVDQHGSPVTLSGLRGRPVLVVFFPWTFSGLCSGELRALRDSSIDDSAALVGISVDSMFAQRTFSDRDSFAFPLLADCWPHGAVADSYGVLDVDRGVALRASFLIDADGIIRWSVVNGLGQLRDVADHVAALHLVARVGLAAPSPTRRGTSR